MILQVRAQHRADRVKLVSLWALSPCSSSSKKSLLVGMRTAAQARHRGDSVT